jgi:hypothetical protein
MDEIAPFNVLQMPDGFLAFLVGGLEHFSFS